MAQAKFRNNISMVRNENNEDHFVDSGATHNFFLRRSSFISYQSLALETFQVADGNSLIVVSGTVRLLLGKNMVIKILPISGLFSKHPCSTCFVRFLLSLHFIYTQLLEYLFTL